MDSRLMAAVTSSLEGVNVTKLCKQHEISTKTFYKWRNRYLEEGLAGLYERTRRPRVLARTLPEEVVQKVLALRDKLLSDGDDAGPASIQWHMADRGELVVPSESTIWRILVREGKITPAPKKRPKSSYVRFEAEFPNECWQIDATEFSLADGTIVWIFNIIDDHSRLCIRSLAVEHATSENAWIAFSFGVEKWGLPVRCLSDNGLAFSGKLRGFEVHFEKQLRLAGIKAVTSRPYHPQTCGKVERFQQTLKRWLKAREKPQSIEELQILLDDFAQHYNYFRPHRSIGQVAPFKRWSGSTPAKSDGVTPKEPTQRVSAKCSSGVVKATRQWTIAIGAEFSGKQAEVIINGLHCLVFIEGRLIRALELDPTRKYQPSGLPSGRRTKKVS